MAAFWKDETNVTIHRVGLHDSWPQVVQPLAERLSQHKSLPSWLYKGPYPFVSEYAEHLVSELKHAHRDVDTTESASSMDDVASSRLIKVFDTVMCTATSLRRYTDRHGFDDSGVASVYILALVRQIIFTYWPHLSVFEGARFVFPRHPTHGSNSLMKFTDTSRSARLLIMLRTSSDSHEKSAESDRASLDHSSPDASDLIPDFPVKKDNAIDDDGASDSESESSDVDDDETSSEASSKSDRWTVDEIALGYRLRRRSPVSELTHISEGTGCKSSVDLDEDDASQEQVQPTPHTQLDPRLDRQLLQCLSVEDPVYISMLCVGSLDEIWGIMASTLYQRWALGILEPVIGVTFESGFTVAQIVLGWLEDCDVPSDLASHLLVHIAFGMAGAYDLRNPLASLLFAESMSSLGERMGMTEPSFLTLSENSQLSPTSWRSDLFGKSSAIDERDSHQKVKSWLDESSIYWRPDQMSSESAPRLRRSPRNASSTSPDPSATSSAPDANFKESPSPSRPLASGPGTSITNEFSESTSQSELSIVVPDNQDIATSDDQGSVGAVSTRSKRFSASAFAAASNDTEKLYSNCVVAWMGFRLVFSYAFPVPKPGEAPFPLPSPLRDYNDYTAFYVPAWFNRLDEVLVEDDLGDMLSELEENYEARKVAVQYGRLPPAKELSATMSTFVRSKLSIILRAAKNARRKKEAAQYETVSEAESRIDWDNLIIECAVGPAVDTKLEHTIKFPRNQDLELSDRDRISRNWGQALARWLQDWAHFRQNDAQVQVVNSNAPPAAIKAAEDEQKNLETMAVTAEDEAQIMRTRMDSFRNMSLAKLEPKTGRCDAVVRLSIPGILAKQHVGKFKKADFALLSTSRPSYNQIDTAAPPIIPRPTNAKDFSDLMASSRLQAAIVQPYALSRSSVESVAVALFQTQISESEHALSATATPSSGPSSTTPLSTPSSSSPPTTTPNANRATIDRSDDDLTLSILNIEYKKLLDTIILTGVNQGRMYGVSVAKYFEALGIEEFPSFTLIVEGSIGVVTCAYVETPESTMPKVTKLYEKNAISFDISNPLDALNFATFSHFIATTHAEKLRARFEEVKDAFYVRCKHKDETLRWNMAHQSGTGGSSHLRVPSLGTK